MTPLWKLFGAALTMGAGVFGACHASVREKKRLAVTDGWIELIDLIKVQIDCFLLPVDEIFATVPAPLLLRCGEDARSPTALLEAARPYLDNETLRLLEGFVGALGGSYREEQLKRCEYTLSALRERRGQTATETANRIKLCTTLSVSAAVGALILLW